MSSVMLRRKADEKLAAAQKVFTTAASENRATSEEEDGLVAQFNAEADKLESQATALEGIEKKRGEYGKTNGAGPIVVVGHNLAEDKPWNSLGENLKAIINFYTPGGKRDDRLKFAISGASESVPSDGGVLVDQQFAPGIIDHIYARSTIASRCSKMTIGEGFNGLKINGVDESSRATGSRWGGVQAYWTGEGETKTKSKPTFEQIEIILKKLAVLIYATDELLQDATALSGFLDKVVPAEIAWMLDDAILHGDGTNKPLGIMNSAALVTVAKDATQTTPTIIAANVAAMRARMWPGGLNNAVWIANQGIDPYLMTMGVAVGSAGGTAAFLPAGGLSVNPYDTLFGRPIIYAEQANALGTPGDLIFADLTQYQLVEKGGLQYAISIHVEFVDDETVMRWVLRTNGKPLWTSTLTPANGSNAVSPFVALAARP